MRARFFQKVQADKGARTVGIFQIRIFVLFKTACPHGLSARVERMKWQPGCEHTTIGESGLSFPMPSIFFCMVSLSLPYRQTVVCCLGVVPKKSVVQEERLARNCNLHPVQLVFEQKPILAGRHGCYSVGGRYLHVTQTGNKERSTGLMVLRVWPTPTRFLTHRPLIPL